MRLVFADAAERDLEDIALYIAEDSPIRAVTFTNELQDKSLSLLQAPFKGAPRESLLSGLRLLPYGNYNIYYRVESEILIVLRIMNSALDARRDDFL